MYIDNVYKDIFNVLLTSLGVDAIPVLMPMIVTGETIEKQQSLFLKNFKLKMTIAERWPQYYPAILFPVAICTDMPTVAENSYKNK